MSEDIRGEDDDRRPRRRRDEGDDYEAPRRRRPRDDEEEPPKGSGSTLMWLLIGGGAFLFFCVGGGFVMFSPSVSRVREASERVSSSNNLKQIGLAQHNHESAMGRIATDVRGPDGKALLSWRVLILPYVEEDNLYRQFNLNEAWDGPTNKRLLSQMPKIYVLPSRRNTDDRERGLTYYQSIVGPRTVFDPALGRPVSLGAIPDGAAHTILALEAPDPVEWTKPADITYDPNGPVPPVRAHHSLGLNVLFCDGAVRQVRPREGPDFERRLRLAIQINDNIVENLD